MYAVGRIGSYITRGVYTVSGPFHPFGGAVDIVVVEQPDGSFKSSPWYVRFGKFQGVLKTREKVVNICVNGVEANIDMYLDERGEAYFLREVEEEDGESVLCSSPTGDGTDGKSKKNLGLKNSKSCYDNGNKAAMGDQIDARNGKILSRADSPRRSRSIGFLFGRRSRKQDSSLEEGGIAAMPRISSLDRAEIAADLLEVKWSTNLDALPRRYDASQLSASDKLDGQGDQHAPTDDEESRSQPMHYSNETVADNHIVAEESGSCSVVKGSSSHSGFVSLEYTVERTDVEMLNLQTAELPDETSGIDKSTLEGKFEGPSEISTIIDQRCLQKVDLDSKTDSFIPEISTSNSEIPIVLGVQACKKIDKEQTSGESGVALPGILVSDEVSQSKKCQSFVSRVEPESPAEQTHETLYVAGGESMQVQFCAHALHTIAKPLSEDKDHEAKNIVLERDHIEVCKSTSQEKNPSPCMHGHDEVKLEGPVITSESCAYIVSVDPLLTSAVDVDSESSCSIPNFNCMGHRIQDENNIMDRVSRNELQPSLDIVGQPEQIHDGHGSIETTNISESESSEEEQFLFSDLDDFKPSEPQCESKYQDGVNIDRHPSVYLEGSMEVKEPFKTRNESYLFPEQLVEENRNPTLDNLKESSSKMSSPIGIPKVDSVDAEIARMVESLPVWSHIENLDSVEVCRPLSHSLELKSKSMEWTFHIKDNSHSMDLDAAIQSQPAHKHLNSEDTFESEDLENFGSNPAAGDPTSGGSWKLWPFSSKRSGSANSVEPALDDIIPSEAENAIDNNIGMDRDRNMLKSKVAENKIRSKTPTSEQLVSLNLMEGKNVVTFTFSTTVLGKQQVDARIFLWKWNTRIVISDVDGTITRSDVLGQFMPLVGVDWSQTGVAHLFSAIKENGYQLLFLSARSISQAYITRQFLVNLKQDGKALPDGPVVISPDGLFPSLYREVIRRAPHEFKIACLEDIRVLFPPDCNPFYAGFGNRDTDEISYLKVGIPKGKIFIINPKGEVAVHRRVDTKSYTSLHALVHDMFPPSQSFEQEDFNSWNFWKLPSPFIDS